MPIALKNLTIQEDSPFVSVEDDPKHFIQQRLDVGLFDEIRELMDQEKKYDQEEKESKRKIEKYSRGIAVAEEMIAKAVAKKESLIKRNEFLKKCIDEKEEKKKISLQYWRDYGLDIKLISNPEDIHQQYEFIYSKLPARLTSEPTSVGGDEQMTNRGDTKATSPITNPIGNGDAKSSDHSTQCSIIVKYDAEKLEIVEQLPEILPSDEQVELNTRLTENCVDQKDRTVDYKLAMIMIKKALIKSIGRGPKISSHPQAETNSHTYS